MSAPVFLAEAHDLDSYAVGDIYVLDGAEGRHAGVVQRRGPGEQIDVVDGIGMRLSCKIKAVHQDCLDLEVMAKTTEVTDGLELVLVQALAKGDRDELAIEAATEVGVDRIIPWQADRSIVIWRGARAAKSLARWQSTVRSATKQARRASLPIVDPWADSKSLMKKIAAVVTQGGAALVLHEEATTPIRRCALPAVKVGAQPEGTYADQADHGNQPEQPEAKQVLFIVGPEGGMNDSEVEGFLAAGAQLARLGPHVLRTSTAGPIGLSLISEKIGRWN